MLMVGDIHPNERANLACSTSASIRSSAYSLVVASSASNDTSEVHGNLPTRGKNVERVEGRIRGVVSIASLSSLSMAKSLSICLVHRPVFGQ